jgi:hypothetical protein
MTMANFQVVNGYAQISVDGGKLVFSIKTASAHGFNINPKTKKSTKPTDTTFSFEDSRIHLENGDSFPAKYIPNSEYVKTKLPDLTGL